MHMPKFRKKPVVIEAMQYTTASRDSVITWCNANHTSIDEDGVEYETLYLGIHTLEGLMLASLDDWIIKGIKGEFYPCKPDIFEATYEEVNLDKELSQTVAYEGRKKIELAGAAPAPPPPKSCYSCETGFVRPTNVRGRSFDYRDTPGLVIDVDLTLPVCDACGELWLRGEDSTRFREVLERLRGVAFSSAGVPTYSFAPGQPIPANPLRGASAPPPHQEKLDDTASPTQRALDEEWSLRQGAKELTAELNVLYTDVAALLAKLRAHPQTTHCTTGICEICAALDAWDMRGASALTPELKDIKELDQAALDLAEKEYWRDNGDARHNLAVAILVYLNAS